MKKLLWMDLEMTGLNPQRDRIIECAVMVTDMDFNALDSFEAVVLQPPEVIALMDDWNKTHHGASGLLAKIPQGTPETEVEAKVRGLIDKHWPQRTSKDDLPVLCGNSIGQDRAFINQYWKKVSETLHYRMLDVTSFKIIFNQKYSLKYDKKGSHRALEDIQESIGELRFYLKHFRIN